MRFLIDAQLPPALARWLSSAGHDAEHVADIGLAGAGTVKLGLRAQRRRSDRVKRRRLRFA
jgi:predicted nuclease of predicted toxin-antitoxin system